MATAQQDGRPQLCAAEQQLARAFVEQYYRTFDANRGALPNMFRDVSTVSFEGDVVVGGANFYNKLASMGIPAHFQHRIVTVDAQPSVAGGGAVLVFVTGEYAGNQHSEVFQLVRLPDGTYYVHNCIFRVGDANPFNVPEAARAVATGFIQYYYSTFDSRRGDLLALYKPHSFLTLEDGVCQGQAAILERLQTIPPVQHDPASILVDVQQIRGNEMLLLFVRGRLVVEENPLNFSEMFVLVQEGAGYYVGNHLFKFNYG